jgi:uncharacterized membrane protein
MELRVVAAGRGWRWVAEGLALFLRSPGNWMAVTLLLGGIWLASLFIPVVGPLLFNLFSPLFFAGLMAGCRALEEGKPLEIPHLFSAFKLHAGPLVTIGGVYLVGTILVIGIVLAIAGGSLLPTLLSKQGAADLETMRQAARSVAIALSVGAAVYLPLIMLIWFAPLLVVFDGMAPVPAMKLSFEACLRNTVPFLVYGLAILAAWIVLSLPAAFGMVGAVLVVGLLVLSIPVLICSVYASYRDIFSPARAQADPANPFLK